MTAESSALIKAKPLCDSLLEVVRGLYLLCLLIVFQRFRIPAEISFENMSLAAVRRWSCSLICYCGKEAAASMTPAIVMNRRRGNRGGTALHAAVGTSNVRAVRVRSSARRDLELREQGRKPLG